MNTYYERGFNDDDCEGCDPDPLGCVFPGRCLMPGIHLESECHTAEMVEAQWQERE